MSAKKYRTHPKYTIEQKNEIVIAYLSKELSHQDVILQFDINKSVLARWVHQYRVHGTTIDDRGKGKKSEIPNKGRPKKIDFDSMTKDELIEYIKVGEDIKKTVAYLRRQKKSIKS